MIKEIQRSDGTRYQVYGRRGGKKIYVSTHDTRKSAEKAEKRHDVLQDQIKSGELPAEVDGKRLMGPALDEWLAAIKTQRSHEPYTSRVINHVKPTLEGEVLTAVTPDRLIKLAQGLSNGSATLSKDPVGRSTIDGVLGMLGSFFSFAIASGWVGKGGNPVPDTKQILKGSKKGLLPARKPVLVEWISDTSNVTKLIAACHPNIRTLIAILIGTGLRIDEALHLQWSDIDLANRTITVARGRKGTPKSGKPRMVEIFDSVLPILKAMKLAAGKNTLLWPSPFLKADGTQQPRTQSGTSVPFKLAVKRAGLSETLHLHSCRHTFSGLYLTNGGDIYRLSKLLGHSSVKITETTYGHLVRGAFAQDRGRVSFAMPTERTAKVISLHT